MDEDSTTAAAANQDDATTSTTATDQTATTDSRTADDKTGSDNSDTSKSTDASGDDDKSTTTDKKDDTSSAPKFDTDLDEWAEKTGRPKPTTDRERELYQEIRDSRREFSRSKQAKDATTVADKAIADAKPADTKTDDDDDRDPVEIRQDNIEAQLRDERHMRLRGEYFVEKSVTPEESKVMGDILKEKVERAKTPEAKKQAYDYWTHPDQLEDWHMLAKARLGASSATDTTVVEEEAARKERARIAKESQAAGGNRNATTTTPAKKPGYNRTEFLKSDD